MYENKPTIANAQAKKALKVVTASSCAMLTKGLCDVGGGDDWEAGRSIAR